MSTPMWKRHLRLNLNHKMQIDHPISCGLLHAVLLPFGAHMALLVSFRTRTPATRTFFGTSAMAGGYP
jgi:hypothetical protein